MNTVKKQNPLTKRREPFNFMLWIGIGSSVLVFTILLAAYVVRKANGAYWTDVPLPRLFWVSTLAIMVSSFTLHLANRSFHSDRYPQFRLYLGATLSLGLLFVILQFWGWYQLIEAGISTLRNPSVGFIYLLSGLHILHIALGITTLCWLVFHSLKNITYVDAFVFSVNPPNQLKFKLISIYWHFVDILWLYLFAFLLYHHGF
ncbi:heme-copper oxidase subunit III [Runella sp. MFBS21]|uniref:cytochrome c oxidase subunit 3 n=1 Tax=Runella sp. MFBS21 TaxID=3034018 RepID=UPI0023F936A9|nr:heme-copper oxidase subunit III [Runella sp. MFBS21]MDF7817761.1 heme-copper oxidase subunit III [Runella sp. MFBS21]